MSLHTQNKHGSLSTLHSGSCNSRRFLQHGCKLVRQQSIKKSLAPAVAGSNSPDSGDKMDSVKSSPMSSPNSAIGLIQRWQQQTRHIQKQLQDLGAAGVVAYGMFNTLYYTVAFLLVWSSMGNASSGQGFGAAARKAAEVFALVWAGSQVTKLLRAGAAVACAPLLGRMMSHFKVENRQTAYLLIVVCCVGFAAAVMALVIACHA